MNKKQDKEAYGSGRETREAQIHQGGWW